MATEIINFSRVSSTQVKLASGSIVKIGGRFFRISSDLFLTGSSLVANTLYMVYAVRSGGVVSLVQSTNVNSVGPAGYSAWSLVGAFVTTAGTPTIGASVTIDGRPTSEEFVNNSGFTMAANFGSLSYYNVYQQMVGSVMKVRGSLAFGTVTSGAQVYLALPINWDNTRFPDGANQVQRRGQGEVRTSGATNYPTNPYAMVCFTDPTALDRVFFSNSTTSVVYDKASSSTLTTGQGFGFSFEVPVVGWSNTPLRNL